MSKLWNKDKTLGLVALSSILIICIGRWMPHPPNFTPMVGAAIFGGAMLFRRAWIVLLPILAFWISDLFLNNLVYASYFEGFVWMSTDFIFAAIALAIIALMATLLRSGSTTLKIAGFSLSGSLIFFLISNFGVWASATSIFPKTFSGLMTAYVAGLPYMLNGVLGDLFYCGVFFGGYALYRNLTADKASVPV